MVHIYTGPCVTFRHQRKRFLSKPSDITKSPLCYIVSELFVRSLHWVRTEHPARVFARDNAFKTRWHKTGQRFLYVAHAQCSKRPNPLKLTLVGISRFSGALVGPSRGSRHMTSVL